MTINIKDIDLLALEKQLPMMTNKTTRGFYYQSIDLMRCHVQMHIPCNPLCTEGSYIGATTLMVQPNRWRALLSTRSL